MSATFDLPTLPPPGALVAPSPGLLRRREPTPPLSRVRGSIRANEPPAPLPKRAPGAAERRLLDEVAERKRAPKPGLVDRIRGMLGL